MMLSKSEFCSICKGKDKETPKGPSFKARFKGWCDECYNQPTGVERLEKEGKLRISRHGISWVRPEIKELIEYE